MIRHRQMSHIFESEVEMYPTSQVYIEGEFYGGCDILTGEKSCYILVPHTAACPDLSAHSDAL